MEISQVMNALKGKYLILKGEEREKKVAMEDQQAGIWP